MTKVSRRKGFTLVELLIVIVVIGILAAMMMLSSTETVSTAKATKIIADMNNIKRATIAWYVDNRELVKDLFKRKQKIQYENRNNKLGISNYLQSGTSLELNKGNQDELLAGTYGIYDVYSRRTTWYVGYKFLPNEEDVKRKLADRAESAGLIFAQKWPNPEDVDKNPAAFAKNLTGYETVWMFIMGDNSSTGWWNQEEVNKQNP